MKEWTDIEKSILKVIYFDFTREQILAALPNRSWSAIVSCAKKLKLKRRKDLNSYFWTKEEIKILRNNYSKLETEELIKLLPNKNHNSIYLKASRLGLVKGTRWSNKELSLLKSIYPTMSKKQILEKLPNRTWNAILRRVNELGLKKEIKESKTWTDDEILFLKQWFRRASDEFLMDMLPDKTWTAIIHKASRLGLLRERKKDGTKN